MFCSNCVTRSEGSQFELTLVESELLFPKGGVFSVVITVAVARAFAPFTLALIISAVVHLPTCEKNTHVHCFSILNHETIVTTTTY